MNFFTQLLDEIFPRICLCCRECEMDRWFCSACWELLSLPQAKDRCRHCFTHSEFAICSTCRKISSLEIPRAWVFDPSLPAAILQKNQAETEDALAAAAFLFWNQLNWPIPHAIIPIPDEEGKKSIFSIAQKFAKLVNSPYEQVFKRTYRGFLEPDLVVSAHSLKANQIFLLLDGASSLSWLKVATKRFSEVFAKRVMILSLFGT